MLIRHLKIVAMPKTEAMPNSGSKGSGFDMEGIVQKLFPVVQSLYSSNKSEALIAFLTDFGVMLKSLKDAEIPNDENFGALLKRFLQDNSLEIPNKPERRKHRLSLSHKLPGKTKPLRLRPARRKPEHPFGGPRPNR